MKRALDVGSTKAPNKSTQPRIDFYQALVSQLKVDAFF